VDEGRIGCDYNGAVWFQAKGNGPRYALNGKARSKYPGIEPIWAMDKAFMAASRKAAGGVDTGVVRLNITDLLEAARALCSNP
jgi:hypothetical protein